MRVRKEWKIIMRKQAWLAAAIFGCSVLMAGCGTADKSYQKGIQAMQAGKYEDAGKYLQKAIKENGDRAEYYIAYGMYLNEQGEYDEALKQFKNAYQDTKNTIANVNNKQVYLGQAIAYSHLQEYEKALDACDKALELKNTESLNHRIWCSKGVVLEALGRQDEAVKAYQKAVDENKENWQAYYRLGAIYQELGDNDAAGQAQEFLNAAYQKGNQEATYYLGMLSVSQGDKDKGKKYLTKFVSKGSGEYLQTAYNTLAAMAIQEEDYSVAEEYLSKARASAKGAAAQELSRNQMILMEKQGMFGEALTIAQDYLKQYPEDKAMKREYRFLKTRDAIAKGNEAVQSTVDIDDTDTSGGADSPNGDHTVKDVSGVAATKAPVTSNKTAEPAASAATGVDRTSKVSQEPQTATPAGSSAAAQQKVTTAPTATPQKNTSSYTDTEESVN